jgi:hypothetical protein
MWEHTTHTPNYNPGISIAPIITCCHCIVTIFPSEIFVIIHDAFWCDFTSETTDQLWVSVSGLFVTSLEAVLWGLHCLFTVYSLSSLSVHCLFTACLSTTPTTTPRTHRSVVTRTGIDTIQRRYQIYRINSTTPKLGNLPPPRPHPHPHPPPPTHTHTVCEYNE